MRKRLLLVMLISFCLLGLCACGNNESQEMKGNEEQTYTENYVAYVKINPSIQLNYSRTCKKVDGKEQCEEPIVNSYELINDDAKEIYKDVDLLEGEKDLVSVINKICVKAKEEGIDVSKVEIQSDWQEVNTYIEGAVANQHETQENITENQVDLSKVDFNVEVEQKEEITTKIEEDVQTEIREKEEAERKAQEEAERKAREEEERKAKEEAETIYLSDGVTYSHTGRGYCCEGCFSDSLIKSIKSAKGYAVTNANSSRIDIKYITKLSPSKYNTSTFKGSSIISKITNAGGEECGGLGGEDEPLTSSVCSEYHLKCK